MQENRAYPLDDDYYPSRSLRQSLQMADSTLDDNFRDQLGARLVVLNLDASVVDSIMETACYANDGPLKLRLMSYGLQDEVINPLIREANDAAEQDLRAEFGALYMSADTIDSVMAYITTVLTVSNGDVGDIDREDQIWQKNQMLQLGAAGENCPPEYLDAVVGATTFLIAHHPDPTSDTFHIYKRFSQSGHIHLRDVVERLERKGLEPNQIRAVLNIHKNYGAQLGSAYLPLLRNAHELVDYRGGIPQLVADFADRKISPKMQACIVSQAGKSVDYPGGALRLAMDLSERHVAPELQEAIIEDCYYFQDYDKGIVQLALDLIAAGFPLSMQLNLIRKFVNRGISPSEPLRPYVLGLRKLYAINPLCVSAEFGCEYVRLDHYALVAPVPKQELVDLATDTTAEKLPHLSSEQRIKLFAALLLIIHYPRYQYYREAAFSVANGAAEMDLEKFKHAIEQIDMLAHTFDRPAADTNPKGPLPLAVHLAQDVMDIAAQDQPQIKAHWYHNLLYNGVDRDDIMPVLQVPIDNGNWRDRALAFRPCFAVIAPRFFSGDPAEQTRLLPIVALLVRDAYHYCLSRHMLKDKQPNALICRYVFGIGPEEEAGITVADIACCEAMVEHRPVAATKLIDGLRVVEKLAASFPEFAARLTTTVVDEVKKEYHSATGRNYHKETPFELIVAYLLLDQPARCSDLVTLFANPSSVQRLSLAALDQLADISATASTSYPAKADLINHFVRTVLGRQNPLYERALDVGYTPKALMASVASTNTSGVLVRVADARELATLAKHLEASSVIATPDMLGEIAPTRLTRAAAAQLGYGNKSKAGMLLNMLAQTWPIAKGRDIELDDDLGPIWRHVLESRIERPGFPVEGAKVHVAKAVDLKLVDRLIEELGLRSTPFRTIHAGKTVLIPPGQPIEIKVVLNYLRAKGLFDDQDFDMQVCIGGRLKAKRHEASIGVVNAAMLLATQATRSYEVNAWSTPEHNHLTNAYIMAYGDGVRVRGMPYDIVDPNDRTDRLGCRDVGDLDLYQIICTLIMHYEFGGYFADLGELFLKRVIAILQRYQLSDTLFDAPWVFEPNVTPRTADTSTCKHWQMVQKYTAMRIVAEEMPHTGITGEVRRVLNEVYGEATKRFDQIRKDHPDEFGKLCTL